MSDLDAAIEDDRWALMQVRSALTRLVMDSRECLNRIEAVIGPPRTFEGRGLPSVSVLYGDELVSCLELSCRAENCLKNEGIRTVAELVAKSDGQLLRMPNFGKKSLREIKEALAHYHKTRAQ